MADQLALLLKDGLDHIREGRLREAIAAWQEVLRIDPGNRRAKEFLENALSGSFALGSGMQRPASSASSPSAGAPVAADPSSSRPGVGRDGVTRDMRDPSGFSDSTEPHTIPHRRMAEVPPGAEDQEEGLLATARRQLDLDDFTGAMDAAERVLALSPGHIEATAIHARCVETLQRMYESRLGARSKVPRMVVKPDEVIWLNLDNRAGFLLAQMDGRSSLEDLFAVSAMPELETARLLCQLIEEKVIRVE